MQLKVHAVAITAVASLFFSNAYAAEPQVVAGFGCNFNPGKGLADLEAVTAYYVANRAKIASPALQKMRSVIWQPLLGSVDVDFVWFDSNLTFNEWGEVTDAISGSEVGAAVQAKFDEAITCPGSGLSINQELFRTEKQFAQDGSVVIESFRCNLHAGKTMADSDSAIAAWKPVFDKAVASIGAASYVARRVPAVSGTGFDLSYLAVWDDASTYAKANTAFAADPDSAKSDALFAAAHTCQNALFTGRVMVAAPN